jgi:DNA-binding NtrC family response regulator
MESPMKSVLVASKDKEVFSVIQSSLRSEYRVNHALDKDAALEMFGKKRYDLMFIDVEILRESVPWNGYKVALQSFWRLYPTVQIIVMSSQEMIREAVKAVKEGADQFWETDSLEVIQTESSVMRKVFDKIRSVAPTKSTVLLMGETGTGKGVLAKLIHGHSNRRDAQFISIHCGAIPDTLVESELFGHERGAFTGADRRKLGKFEIAHGGTIFLDEIGTITPAAQIKLLQILQDGTFQRVGGVETLEADIRIIAATNMDLERMCEDGQFRKDLYYRLNVFPIQIPPLQERAEDIPHLVTGFLRKMNKFNTKEIHDVDHQIMEAFRNYSWPGNIRELENLMERAYILETSAQLTPESFPSELFAFSAPSAKGVGASSLTLTDVRRKAIEETERRYLKDLLTEKRGRIKAAAEAAGVTTRQLHKIMAKYGIRKEEFK